MFLTIIAAERKSGPVWSEMVMPKKSLDTILRMVDILKLFHVPYTANFEES